jgi:hypothetical protein
MNATKAQNLTLQQEQEKCAEQGKGGSYVTAKASRYCVNIINAV